MQEGAPQGQPLLPALRQVPRGAVLHRFQPRHGEDPLGPLPPEFRRNGVNPQVEAEILGRRQFLVEGELLGHVADHALDPLGLPEDVDPRHLAPAGGRAQDAAEHADRRGLARSVGAEKTEDLAPLHRKGDPVHRDEVTEALLQLLDGDGVTAERLHLPVPRPRPGSGRSWPPPGRGSPPGRPPG